MTRFTLRDFLKVLALGILLYALFSGIFLFFPGAGRAIGGMHPTAQFVIEYLIQSLILFFPLWIFVVLKYSATTADFGLQKVSILKLIKTVSLAYLFYIVVSLIISEILLSNSLSLPGYGEQESYMPIFGYDTLGITVGMIFVVIIAPFLEELFFRGFVYRVFTKTWPVWMASILTAFLFASIHFQFQTFLPLFFLGLLLNYVYQKTGSIWTAIAFHSFNNALAFSLDLYLYFHPELLQNLESLAGLTRLIS
ncbi:MAG: type II CAAX endopeptidase family protein [Candidatus Gracilibacteria bacterium]